VNPKDFFKDLSATPVTASRTHARSIEPSTRPAWLEADPIQAAAPLVTAKGGPIALKPAQDEWGMFDPDQCGSAALFARLDTAVEVEKAK
jgi:hypothetical protein